MTHKPHTIDRSHAATLGAAPRAAAIALGIGLLMAGGFAQAAVFNDNWESTLSTQTFGDARTDDNKTKAGSEYRWDIDAGADNYSQELYERPTASMDEDLNGAPASKKYYEYLDIATGKFAIDRTNKVAYFSIDLVGQNEVDQSGKSDFKGFGQFYRVRVAGNADFANGFMFGVKDPYGNSVSSSFSGSNASKTTQAWDDTGTPVTGTGLTVTDEGTTGYGELTGEGKSNAIRSRITGNSVQIAVAYEDLGISEEAFMHLIFEANKGLTDVQNYFWNDAYSLAEAGSPYDLNNPVDGNIYELDTLKGVVPIPAALPLFLSALAGLGVVARRKARQTA